MKYAVLEIENNKVLGPVSIFDTKIAAEQHWDQICKEMGFDAEESLVSDGFMSSGDYSVQIVEVEELFNF